MKITNIRFERVEGEFVGQWAVQERQVGALDLYPEYRRRGVSGDVPGSAFNNVPRRHEPWPISGLYMHIDTDEGLTGDFGAIEPDQAFQISRRLKPHLLGQDPLATERLWDIMSRHDRHGRRGYMMMAISAVDTALWDIRGKAAGLPVYRLLGGPTRDAIPAYASCLGMPIDPERLASRAQALKAEGFVAQKWFFRYGPGDGRAGLLKNVEMVRLLREAVGDEVDLMFDAWLGWDVPYTVEMCRRIEPYGPRWLEEPVAPDRLTAYAEIRRQTSVPIASGEHEYTRWGFKALLDAEGVDVVQADPDWTGGISELTKIMALCSAYDKPVIPHGHSVAPALHVVAAQSPAVCPLLEFLLVYLEQKQWFHQERINPVNGMVALPQAPGVGIALDESRILRRHEVTFDA